MDARRVFVGAFVVLMVPAFALIGLAVVALAAVAALVALAGIEIQTHLLELEATARAYVGPPSTRS
jgi:hypothetical protein